MGVSSTCSVTFPPGTGPVAVGELNWKLTVSMSVPGGCSTVMVAEVEPGQRAMALDRSPSLAHRRIGDVARHPLHDLYFCPP